MRIRNLCYVGGDEEVAGGTNLWARVLEREDVGVVEELGWAMVIFGGKASWSRTHRKPTS